MNKKKSIYLLAAFISAHCSHTDSSLPKFSTVAFVKIDKTRRESRPQMLLGHQIIMQHKKKESNKIKNYYVSNAACSQGVINSYVIWICVYFFIIIIIGEISANQRLWCKQKQKKKKLFLDNPIEQTTAEAVEKYILHQ